MIRTLPLAFLFILGCVEFARATDVEIFGGLAFWSPALDTRYDASYTPSRVLGINQLFTDPDPRSSARQLLTLQGDTGVGFGLGVNVLPHSVLGFQFLLDRARVDIVGENPPHEVNVTYDTIAFPNPDPIVSSAHFRFEWPDTQGTLEETTLSFNLATRFGTGRVVSGSVSGGLSYFRFHVEAERIGAHAAWLGGHAVLFSELHEMTYSTSVTDALGFNVGGQLDVGLGSHVAVFADGRFLKAPETASAVGLDEHLSADIVTVPLQQIEAFLALPPLEIDPSYVRLLFGLKLKL
ncbi:MAG TPA: hypothetical protein VLK65_11900 [Vicinamibacteria bacterium]|nr:hypothetical protein [Vicinamibacteria bacterium]